jgi:hypothetical protein
MSVSKPLGELELMTQRVTQLEHRLNELEQMLLDARPAILSPLQHELLASHLKQGATNGTEQ